MCDCGCASARLVLAASIGGHKYVSALLVRSDVVGKNVCFAHVGHSQSVQQFCKSTCNQSSECSNPRRNSQPQNVQAASIHAQEARSPREMLHKDGPGIRDQDGVGGDTREASRCTSRVTLLVPQNSARRPHPSWQSPTAKRHQNQGVGNNQVRPRREKSRGSHTFEPGRICVAPRIGSTIKFDIEA